MRLGGNRDRLGDPQGGAPAQLVAGWVSDKHLISARVVQTHTIDSERGCVGPGNVFPVFQPLIGQRLRAGRLDPKGDTGPGGHHAILRFRHESDRHVDNHRGLVTRHDAPLVGNRDRIRSAMCQLDIGNFNLGAGEPVEHLPVEFPLEVKRLRATCGNNHGQGLALSQHIAGRMSRDDRRLQDQQAHLRAGHLAGRVAGHDAVFAGVRLLHVVEGECLPGGAA